MNAFPNLLLMLAVSTAALPLRAAEPLTLRAALTQALADNPDARIAEHRVRAAQAGLQPAHATWWPQVKLQSGYLYTDNPVSVFGATLNQKSFSPFLDFNDVPGTDNFNVRGMVSMPVYAGGRMTAARDAARSSQAATRHDAASVRLILGLEVTRTFLAAQRAGDFVRTAEAAVRAYETNLAIARERLAAGTILKTDVLDLEVQLASATEEQLRARNARELTGRALANLLGIENEPVEVSNERVALAVPTKETPDGRPEMESLAERTRTAEAELRGARGGHLPSVNAFGAVDYDYGFRNDHGAASYTVGLMLNWDLWDGNLTRGKVGEADANLDVTREAQRKLRLDLAYEVHRAKLALKEAEERIVVSEKALALARESTELTRIRFEEGAALASRVIDAESALTASRVRHITAVTDREMALAALRRAVGLMPLADESQTGATGE